MAKLTRDGFLLLLASAQGCGSGTQKFRLRLQHTEVLGAGPRTVWSILKAELNHCIICTPRLPNKLCVCGTGTQVSGSGSTIKEIFGSGSAPLFLFDTFLKLLILMH